MRSSKSRLGSRLARLSVLSPAERSLLGWAICLLGAVTVACRFLALTTIRDQLRRAPVPRRRDHVPVTRVGWAVSVASRWLPGGGTCLTRALVAEAMLRRAGEDPTLCIGLTREGSGRVHGHAWVEARGRVVIGGDERDRYAEPVILGCARGAPAGR